MSNDDEVRPKPLLGMSGVGIDDQWPDKVADHIESVVSAIRQRTFEPLRTVATGLVLGLIIGVMAQIALVLAIVAGGRLVNSYFFYGKVWPGYLIVGGIFTLLGMLLWSKRKPKVSDKE